MRESWKVRLLMATVLIKKIQLTHLLLHIVSILDTVAITYDRTLTAREQADKDLQELARDFSKMLESAKKMHLEFEMARQHGHEERANLERAAAEEAKRKQEARERRKMRLQDNLSTQTKKMSEAKKFRKGSVDTTRNQSTRIKASSTQTVKRLNRTG
jgi:hypothetical protein